MFWLAGVAFLLSSAFFLPLAGVAFIFKHDRAALLALALVFAIPASAVLSGFVIVAMGAVRPRR